MPPRFKLGQIVKVRITGERVIVIDVDRELLSRRIWYEVANEKDTNKTYYECELEEAPKKAKSK